MSISYHESLEPLLPMVKNVPNASKAATLKQMMIANNIEPIALGSGGTHEPGAIGINYPNNIYVNGTAEEIKIESVHSEQRINSGKVILYSSDMLNTKTEIELDLPAPVQDYNGLSNYIYEKDGNLWLHEEFNMYDQITLIDRKTIPVNSSDNWCTLKGDKLYVRGTVFTVIDTCNGEVFPEDQLPTGYSYDKGGVMLLDDNHFIFAGNIIYIIDRETFDRTEILSNYGAGAGLCWTFNALTGDLSVIGSATNRTLYNLTVDPPKVYHQSTALPSTGMYRMGYKSSTDSYAVSTKNTEGDVCLMYKSKYGSYWEDSKLMTTGPMAAWVNGNAVYYLDSTLQLTRFYMSSGGRTVYAGTFDRVHETIACDSKYIYAIDEVPEGLLYSKYSFMGYRELATPIEHDLGISATLPAYSPLHQLDIERMGATIKFYPVASAEEVTE